MNIQTGVCCIENTGTVNNMDAKHIDIASNVVRILSDFCVINSLIFFYLIYVYEACLRPTLRHQIGRYRRGIQLLEKLWNTEEWLCDEPSVQYALAYNHM